MTKRLKRRGDDLGYGAAGIWKLELVPRKSGQNKGKYAPHYHILLMGAAGVEDLLEFRVWLSKAWYEVVKSDDEKHLYAGTQCRPVESRAHAMRYVSKYIAKQDTSPQALWQLRILQTGRVWGKFGDLDMTPSHTFTMPAITMPAMRRLIADYLKARGSKGYGRYIKHSKVGFFVLGLGDDSREFRQPQRTTIKRWCRGDPPIDFENEDERQHFKGEYPFLSTIERMLSASWDLAIAEGI